MESKRNFRDRLIPGYARLPLLVALLWNCAVYFGSRLLTGNRLHRDLSTAIDRKIPFLPWTAAIYLGCYGFWVVNYLLAARQSKKHAYRFLSAEFLAKTVCLLCFVALPTTNRRPPVPPHGFWNRVMALIYRMDSPTNLFPSIHCLASWFSYLGVRKQKGVPRWYRGFSLLFAFAVFAVTLTTKQHVFVDVLGGVAIASCAWRLTVSTGFQNLYGRIFDRLRKRKEKIK